MRRVEEDPALPGQPATELDVLDRRVRVAVRVEPSGGVEARAPHGPDAGPERLHVTRRALVDDVVEQVAERRHRALGRDGSRRTTRRPRRGADRSRTPAAPGSRRPGGRARPSRRTGRRRRSSRATPRLRASAGPAPGGVVTTTSSSGGSSAAAIAARQRSSVAGPSVAGTTTASVGAGTVSAGSRRGSARAAAPPAA